MAGQIVMEGFIDLKLPAWLRRLVTRLVAIVPAIVVTLIYGEGQTAKLLILSQVILSFQLPFAIVPLVMFTASRAKMGAMTAPALADGVRRADRAHYHRAERQAARGHLQHRLTRLATKTRLAGKAKWL